MGAFYETIPENIQEWILKQKILWVATAPLSAEGHINVSPKSGKSFGILDDKTFWYHELTGSGIETISHLRENGRITVMFNAFEGSPRIVRLWGHGRILERESPEFNAFVEEHNVKTIPATRSIIIVDVHQVGSSCGYSVPFYEFQKFRSTLDQVFEKKQKNYEEGKSEETMDRYWAYKNAWSIDGLPGMKRGVECGEKEKVEPIVKMVGPNAPSSPFGSGYSRSRPGVQVASSYAWLLLCVLLAFVVGRASAGHEFELIQRLKMMAGV
ncbi:unnamed protein product [Zymoseptoria tritici ST99CH_3D1]|nr:unnamed protein product [Zymoseptoria tritici ST99CH_3D1]